VFRSDEDDRVATSALADYLGVTASTVSATIGRLEERGLVDRIAEVLGHRSVDLHGDPIPEADLSLSGASETTRLADATEGERVLVQRIRQRGDAELRDLADAGIRPDVELTVVDVGSFGMVTVETATDR